MLTSKLFRRLVWGVLWSVLQKCPYFSGRQFSYIEWSALSMQSNFTSYAFFASFSLFFLQVKLKQFDYFWKPIIPMAKFVLTVFWCSTSNTPIVVPWKKLQKFVKDSAPHWPCTCPKCVSGLRRLEKTWTFSDVFMSLTWCSTFVLTELKESGCSFCFTSLFWGIQLHRLLEWLFCVVHVSRRNFLGFHFYGNIRILILKLIWQRRDWLWVFLLDFSSFVTTCSLSSTSNLHGMKPAGSAQTCFSLETSNLFHD